MYLRDDYTEEVQWRPRQEQPTYLRDGYTEEAQWRPRQQEQQTPFDDQNTADVRGRVSRYDRQRSHRTFYYIIASNYVNAPMNLLYEVHTPENKTLSREFKVWSFNCKGLKMK